MDAAAAKWVSTHPAQSYDFSQTHTYSDLSVAQYDVTLNARYLVRPDTWVDARVRRGRYDDREPYLFDQSGTRTFWSLSVGRSF